MPLSSIAGGSMHLSSGLPRTVIFTSECALQPYGVGTRRSPFIPTFDRTRLHPRRTVVVNMQTDSTAKTKVIKLVLSRECILEPHLTHESVLVQYYFLFL